MTELVGKQFGRLTVISETDRRRKPCGSPERRWICLCVCGAETAVSQASLTSGNTRSCGCLLQETRGLNNKIHGDTRSPEWVAWVAMRDRCVNQRGAYQYHAGKGIRVCKRWQEFQNFLSDMGRKPTPAHSLDRVDSNGDYDPSNCRWATRTEQNRNRSNAIIVEHEGRLWRLYEIEALTGVSRNALKRRYYAGKRGADLFASLKTSRKSS